MLTTTPYGMTREVSGSFTDVVTRTREALKAEGFGVLTEIDVKGTLKEKLNRDVAPYLILGACNPQLAASALELVPDIGLLLPCNVVVAERDGHVQVGAVNPQSLVALTENAQLRDIANEADERLRRALESL